MLAALIDGMNEGGDTGGAGAAGVAPREERSDNGAPRTATARTCRPSLSIIETLLGRRRPDALDPRPGPRQLRDRRGGDRRAAGALRRPWAAMAITEPESGLGLRRDPHDRGPRRATGEYVLNGEKIYVTAGERADLVVVWATLDRQIGRRDQVVHRRAVQPRHGARPPRAQARDPRERHRRVPPRGLPRAEGGPARQPRDRHQEGLRRRHADVRQHAAAGGGDGGRRRPGVPGPHPRASCSTRAWTSTTTGPSCAQSAAAAELLGLRGRLRGRAAADPAGGVDGGQPQAQLAAGVDGQGQGRTHRRRRRARLHRAVRRRPATTRRELLEKWARDAKILDIFEGTQQIQLLIIARTLLKKTSAELK